AGSAGNDRDPDGDHLHPFAKLIELPLGPDELVADDREAVLERMGGGGRGRVRELLDERVALGDEVADPLPRRIEAPGDVLASLGPGDDQAEPREVVERRLELRRRYPEPELGTERRPDRELAVE